ncbi:MAG: nucleoside hydrolase [Candidatus Acidiferrales bacterium]
MKRIIIDTDTASDDAVAILLALRSSAVRVEALTIVGGNVDFDQQAENALYTVEVCGKSGEVPVYLGARRPLLRPVHKTVEYVHGRDGMGDSFFPKASQRPEKQHAVDTIIELADRYPGEITLAAIGPFTNVGLALLKDPSLREKLAGIYFMGGTYMFCGNITPAATYNPWVDPEATRIMVQSGAPLTMVGFDATYRYSIFTDADYDAVERLGTPLADFFFKINRTRRIFCKEKQRLPGSNHPDTLTLALLMDPAIGKRIVRRAVDAETSGELTRGMLVIDELGVWGKEPNMDILVEADEARFKSMVFTALS